MAGSHQITGTIELNYWREPREPKQCICCPGFPSHVFGIGITLEPYEHHWPTHFGAERGIGNLGYWLQSVFAFKQMEGRRIRITAELVDEGGTDDPPL